MSQRDSRTLSLRRQTRVGFDQSVTESFGALHFPGQTFVTIDVGGKMEVPAHSIELWPGKYEPWA